MLKMGEKTVSFVQKSYDYSRENPDLVPPFLDIAEYEKDIQAVNLPVFRGESFQVGQQFRLKLTNQTLNFFPFLWSKVQC